MPASGLPVVEGLPRRSLGARLCREGLVGAARWSCRAGRTAPRGARRRPPGLYITGARRPPPAGGGPGRPRGAVEAPSGRGPGSGAPPLHRSREKVAWNRGIALLDRVSAVGIKTRWAERAENARNGGGGGGKENSENTEALLLSSLRGSQEEKGRKGKPQGRKPGVCCAPESGSARGPPHAVLDAHRPKERDGHAEQQLGGDAR